jgi:hypothetical protein
MKKLSHLILGAVLSQGVAFSAFAQEPGPGTSTPAPFQRVTPEDKAQGKALRKAEGRSAVKAGTTTGEGEPSPAPQVKIPKEVRQEARAVRKAETARAAKAGELKPAGEVGLQN